ncbi:DUF952 domain-containing protein [Catellatospora vulcania]|uniref:DUF952 domain-containing protein n=1 Tax=Catellatospora vulcania TaxID=1460450 RepID=UPI0012D451AC|nr:DUF952 domain-containing protein [Catellatospora vulcania]
MIYHIALPEDWAAAQHAGEYTVSTRGVTLAEEGYIHGGQDLAQVEAVRARIYADLDDLRLLVIDESRLDSPVRLESPPGTDELYPHVYGPIPVDAVIEVRTL